MPQIPPKEHVYRAVVGARVGESEDGEFTSVSFLIPAPNEEHTFFIPTEEWKKLITGATAPRIEVPQRGLLVPEGSV